MKRKANLSSLPAFVLFLGISCLPVTPFLGDALAAVQEMTGPQTLQQTFQAALARSETIGIDIELINQAEERYRQALGAVLPNVSVVGSYLRQETPDSASTLYPAGQPLLKIQATQPLFRGFREFAGLRQNKKLTEATQQDQKQAKLLLFNDVVLNFYTVVGLEKTLADYDSEIGAYENRIKELRQRVRIGRSRESEVLTVEASLAGLRSQIESTKGQLHVARELYTFLTGLPENTPLKDDQPLLRDVPSVDYYINGIEQRPDVSANTIRLNASQEQLSIAKGGYLPTADFVGNYYLHRYGATANVNWDVQFLATFPLYAGGTIDSSVRQAVSQIHQSELSVSLTRRTADQQVRAAYQTYQADQRQLEALRASKLANERNLKAEITDYRMGLVTNLDVLNALISYQESERALDAQIFTTKLDYLRLENQSGMNAWIGAPANPTVSGSPYGLPLWFKTAQ
jgi:outer membrane protein